ncbi:hypothetical protein IFM89_023678 [Coptis chinensis]|uniref:non-specific serine/threonine protein kinase n=1 Tax=Coptis chinensis TaxID=261450 RepID=A0A835LEE4_9MAGN|nr:hypothetical protein IFM89_023678 [Coptis chinensis]
MLLHVLCILFFLSHSFTLNQEGLILHRVKLGLTDPDRFLSNWNTQDENPCNWYGITCDPVTNTVNSVSLASINIAGPFPTQLCQLTNLSYLSLYNNSINSSLPLEISTCQNLHHLILAENYLEGLIPYTLSDIATLRYVDLSGNDFSGEIPKSFGNFPRLEVLSLVSNYLNGTIPSQLGGISTLKQLNLSFNSFSPGELLSQLTELTNLENLWCAGCNLVGQIPNSIGQLKNLKNFDVSVNNLHGPIPSSLTELTSIVQVELYNNSLTGELPSNFSNLKFLRRFDVSQNNLWGKIPVQLCDLPLESLNLYQNQFEGSLPDSIARSPNLYELKLFENRLTGELPKNLGEISPLQIIDVSRNNLSGKIPASLCANGTLSELLLIYNSFSGSIPREFGQCSSLTRVRLRNNLLSGKVPSGFWGLPHVYLFEIMENSFSGSISKSICKMTNLSVLLISKNKFTGSIPSEIGLLDKLVQFSCNDNLLSGSIPASLVNVSQLGRLDLHNNGLSGELPLGIRSWKKLNELNLMNNWFCGKIPEELGSLPVLNYLDLSNNQFVGNIPVELENLKLNKFNLSYNYLTGALPPFYAKELYRYSFLGNPGLCADLEGLCRDQGKRSDYTWLLRSIFILAGLVLIIGLAWFYVKYQNFEKVKRGMDKSMWTLTSFHKFGFSEEEILGSLDEDNVIGTGASGKVYKVVLGNGIAVAVKKLWGGMQKEGDSCGDVEMGGIRDDGFEAEVETLGKIRHKNIVKLWCCCTTKDSKFLIYEYMPNGSLGDLLHSTKASLLDWLTRYKIVVDAAEGLSYLHHDCVPPIVHRDVKSNNILLDEHFRARVADFGVAKVVDTASKESKSMSVIAGSPGYIAPEYGYTLRVNEKSDIYSFGVVILELVTGRLPVDPEFGEKDLVKWVCYTVDQKGVDHVLDPNLDPSFTEEICKVLSIGILCTSALPIKRPSMRRVVKMLQEVHAESKLKTAKDGKLTSHYREDSSDLGSTL